MDISRSSVKSSFDGVIVGGGHNGLTCACPMAARSPPARTGRAPSACPPTTRCSTRPSRCCDRTAGTPPADPRRLRDLWGALQMGRRFRKLDAAVQRDIHELFTRSAGDLLDHWFESDPVKALYGFDAVVGAANLGPKPLFLKLLADTDLPAEFRARIERLRVGSATFRMSVALSELPKFTAAPRDDGGRAPRIRNHSCADARVHGSRFRRCATHGHVSQAHRGNADSLAA